jgi:hypothetical protein
LTYTEHERLVPSSRALPVQSQKAPVPVAKPVPVPLPTNKPVPVPVPVYKPVPVPVYYPSKDDDYDDYDYTVSGLAINILFHRNINPFDKY